MLPLFHCPGALVRRAILLAVAAYLLAAVAPAAAPAAQPAAAKPIQVLLVTGVDLHKWRETTPVLVAQLQKDPRIEVHVSEDPLALATESLAPYQVILLHFMNWKVPAPGAAARANLKKAVEGGKGLVLVHFACGAWQDWPEFVNLAGRVWNPHFRAHDKHGPFQVEIANTDHPITQGLRAFETDDELYTCLDGKPPIEVLATARSKVDHKDYPMAFVLTCGRGRVFHCVLGHDAKALGFEGVGELYRRGTAWAAGFPPVVK
jgi:type 1 glutamine amidotransferase